MIAPTYKPSFWRTFLLAFTVIAGYAIFSGRDFLFGPAVMEAGDFAANALVMVDAKSLHAMYGNYSRWGFSHPGPFFFYWYVLGELVFRDLTHLVASPHQAHVLAGIVLQASVIAAAIALLATATRRSFTLPVLFAAAAFVLLNGENAISSIWMPHVLLGPYVLLIVSAAFVARGDFRLFPVVILMTCILCHGHVAQPLMTLPIMLAALIGYVLTERSRGTSWQGMLRQNARGFLVCGAIVAVFLLPILLDLTRCPDCNAQRILAYMGQDHGELPKWRQAVNSIAALFRFNHKPEGISDLRHIPWRTKGIAVMLVVAIGAWLSTSYVARRRPDDAGAAILRTTTLLALLALVLSCVWAKRITGPLYEFNSYFVYGIYFVLVACALASLSLLTGRYTSFQGASGFAWLATVLIAALSPKLPVFSGFNVAVDHTPADTPRYEHRLALINQNTNDEWPSTTALATWAYRSGSDYAVVRSWAYVFGWSHSFDLAKVRAAGDRVDIWERGRANALSPLGFSPDHFCRIQANSPIPDLEGALKPIDAARDQCALAFFGLAENTHTPYTWSIQNVLLMQLRGHHATAGVDLSLRAQPYLAEGRISRQRASFRVNGVEVGSLEFTKTDTLTLAIPAEVWNLRPVVTVEIDLPDAASPASIGSSGDTRLLGLGIEAMGLSYR